LREQQKTDEDIAPALEWVDGVRLSWMCMQSKSPALRALWQQYESLVTKEGVLYRIFHNADGTAACYQLVLPANLKTVLLELVHADAAGHLKSVDKCAEHVQRRAWWHTWKRDLSCLSNVVAHAMHTIVGQPPSRVCFTLWLLVGQLNVGHVISQDHFVCQMVIISYSRPFVCSQNSL